MSDKKTEELFRKALKAKKTSPSNFQSAVLRIQNANTIADLQKLEKSFDRVYNAGHLTVGELQRLDGKIMDKIAHIESGEHALGSEIPGSMDKQAFIKMVLANVKTGKWLSGEFNVNGHPIGVKAYGLWVQRLLRTDLSTGYHESGMFIKNQKALREWLDKTLTQLGIN